MGNTNDAAPVTAPRFFATRLMPRRPSPVALRDAMLPLSGSQLVQRAIAAFHRGTGSKRKQLGRAALDANADDSDALQLLGTLAVQTGRPREAAELLARAAAIRPARRRDPQHAGRCAVRRRSFRRGRGELRSSHCARSRITPRPTRIAASRCAISSATTRRCEATIGRSCSSPVSPRRTPIAGWRSRSSSATPRRWTSYKRALQLIPDYPYVYGNWLHAKMQICDWTQIESQFVRLAGKIERSEKAAAPWQVLATPCSAALQRKAAEIVVKDKYPPSPATHAVAKRAADDRIRIGYFSADFHEHATTHLIAELFERHDRTKFELTAFSFGPDRSTPMRKRLSVAFEDFIDVRERSDKEVASLARAREIDIAVDLKGFSQNGRPGIFAQRAAPIQVSFLGLPRHDGRPLFRLSRRRPTLVPEADRQHYAEKIAYLPESYQVNDTQRIIADSPDCARGARTAGRGIRVLLLQQQLQDHARHVRSVDEDSAARPRKRALAAAGQRMGRSESEEGGAATRGGRRPVDLRAAHAAARAPRAPSRRRSLSRHAALQRPHDGERCAVGGLAGAHVRRRDLCRKSGGEPPSRDTRCPSSSREHRPTTRHWRWSSRPTPTSSVQSDDDWLRTGSHSRSSTSRRTRESSSRRIR